MSDLPWWRVRTVPQSQLEATLNEGAELGYDLYEMRETEPPGFSPSSETHFLLVMIWEGDAVEEGEPDEESPDPLPTAEEEDAVAGALIDADICPVCSGVLGEA